MQKSFDPAEIEARWYPRWEASGAFAPSGDGAPYTILLPPPNVTGTLHMGHAFQHTLIDALIRYHRMRGARALWQLGSDHAGIATEMVVARQLAPSGETRDSLGREAFIDHVWKWKDESGDTIERQMRRLGVSGDWTRRVFTMDPMPSKAVIEAFVRLYDEGLIYRGKRLVNWDPVLQTAISDLEVENVEEMGSLWSIRYPVVDPPDGALDHLVIATTRPETMLGDVAVAVHPDDERYAALVGASLRLPLTGRLIPVIADEYVDREFGTGCVKITPAHDFNDFAIGERHGLAPLNIFDAAASVVDDEAASDLGIPAPLAGLDRYEARREVLEMLKAEGLLVETKPHRLQVPRGDRSGVVIEPWLTNQWFVRMDDMAKRGLELAESGAVRFVPGNWINTWRHFLENSQDWCISRQLWWGHRIPAWFDDAGGIHVGRDEAQARSRSGIAADVALHQDDDVLETWFSSALWPLSTLGWPDSASMAEREFAKHLPTSVLVTGFDILFFWVARMVMMTDQLLPANVPDADRVPFRDVYITGLVRDRDGQKMSKSKGNILDPLDLIDGIGVEELVAKRTAGLMQPKMAAAIEQSTRREFPDGIPAFGTDALRFTFASLASHGRDIKFDLARCEGYKNFCNKLWNAARFVLLHADADESDSIAGRSDFATLSLTNPLDAWLVGRLAATITEVEAEFAAYRFDLASQALYDFIWNDYCDWAIEFAKPRLAAGGDDAATALQVLLVVLEAALRALHPLVPFVTEEIRQHLAPRLGIDPGLTPAAKWPEIASLPVPAAAIVASVERLRAVVTAIRRIRSELQLAPKQPITLQWRSDDAAAGHWLEQQAAQLAALVRTDSVTRFTGTADDEASAAATAVVGPLELLVPLAGLVDEGAERERLDRELATIVAEIAKSKAKLNNPSFVDRAPDAVVAQERGRLADWTHQHEALTAMRAKFS